MDEISNPATGAGLAAALTTRLREAVALAFWEAGAVRVDLESPFELASGNRSPIYVNCRRLISDPAFMALFTAVARGLLERRGAAFDAVAGGETAGIPFAAYLARDTGRAMLYVRKKAKGYGIASKVEGHLEPGRRVLLVEDLITDGGSKLGFLEALREAGGEVTDALVLFDRQQGGAQLLAGHGVHLTAVTDRETTLAAGLACGLLRGDERAAVDEYFADAAAWHQRRGLPFQA